MHADSCAGVQSDVLASTSLVDACRAACWLRKRCACVHEAGAGVQSYLHACTRSVQACRPTCALAVSRTRMHFRVFLVTRNVFVKLLLRVLPGRGDDAPAGLYGRRVTFPDNHTQSAAKVVKKS